MVNDQAVRIGPLSRFFPGRLNQNRRSCEQPHAYAQDRQFHDQQTKEGGCRVSWYGSLDDKVVEGAVGGK